MQGPRPKLPNRASRASLELPNSGRNWCHKSLDTDPRLLVLRNQHGSWARWTRGTPSCCSCLPQSPCGSLCERSWELLWSADLQTRPLTFFLMPHSCKQCWSLGYSLKGSKFRTIYTPCSSLSHAALLPLGSL